MKGERLHYIDIAKGIGIIFIVLSHTNPSFVDFISLFHVPVFFIFSGFFFREKYENQPIVEIKKKVKGLYFPFIRYGLFFLLTLNLFHYLDLGSRHIGSLREFGGRLAKLLLGWEIFPPLALPLWFLPCLLFACIVFVLVRFGLHKLSSLWKELATALLCVGSFVLALNWYVDWNIGRVLLAIPLYYIGYLYFKYKDYIKYNYVYGAIALALLIMSSTFQHVSYFAIEISHPFLFLPVSTIAAYLIVLISYKIGENKVLEYIGQNTIPVIALHLLCFKAFTAIRVWLFGAPFDELGDYFAPSHAQLHLCLIYVVVGVALPLGIHYLWQQLNVKAKSLWHKSECMEKKDEY